MNLTQENDRLQIHSNMFQLNFTQFFHIETPKVQNQVASYLLYLKVILKCSLASSYF